MKILLFSKETPLLARNALAEIGTTHFAQDPDSLQKNISDCNLLVLHGLAGQEVLAKSKRSGILLSNSHLKILALADDASASWENWFSQGADAVLPYPCQSKLIQLQANALLGCLAQMENQNQKISALEWYKSEHHRCMRSQQAMELAITRTCTPKNLGQIPDTLSVSHHKGESCNISTIWGRNLASNHPFLLLIHPTSGSPMELLFQEIISSQMSLELTAGTLPSQILEGLNTRFLQGPTEVPSLINLALLEWRPTSLAITQAGQQFCAFFDGKSFTTISSDCAPLGVPGIRIWKKEIPWRHDCRVFLGFSREMTPACRDLWHQALPESLNASDESILEQWRQGIPARDSTTSFFLTIANKIK